MGDMADYYLEQEIMFGDFCDEYEEFEFPPLVTCRCCEKSRLHWETKDNKWRLFNSKGKLHNCKVNPLKEK
jgi:hypothetical protein